MVANQTFYIRFYHALRCSWKHSEIFLLHFSIPMFSLSFSAVILSVDVQMFSPFPCILIFILLYHGDNPISCSKADSE
jgi:hypothetical protein